ncbi:MAG: SurA N-terminal domain-containing protein [Deltaproteobacteria bacterium]|nr:SurA N-terminal domain-containing protein [Deltaproteobacteria bacterium]
MLGWIRNNTDSPVVKIILGVLSLTFVFFFGSSALFGDRTEVVADVNGEAIRDVHILPLLQQQVRIQRQFNQGKEPDLERLRQQVLDSVIDQRLMVQAAKEEGFLVSDKELRRAILENPSFQDDEGKFDSALYKRFAGRAGSTYEKDLREQLLVEAMQDFIRRSARVSEAELKAAFEDESSKRDIEFVRVPTALFRDAVTLTDDEVSAWAGENEDAITDRFDRDFDSKYNEAKKVKASHILMKFSDDDTDEDKAEVTKLMEAVLAEVKADGADFEALARKYSEDGSASRGGDLGFFDEKRMVKPFSDTAFAMSPGDISELVETQFGLHIIKVIEVQEADVKTLADVKLDIARELLTDERAPELAEAYAKTLLPVLNGTLSGDEADALLADKSLTVQESGEFARKDRRIPKLGTSKDALTAAFNLAAVGDVTVEPIDVGNGFAILKLTSAQQADMAAFDAKKEELRGTLLRTKQTRAVQAFRDQVKADAKIKIAAGV